MSTSKAGYTEPPPTWGRGGSELLGAAGFER
jgi:hypothetical protein